MKEFVIRESKLWGFVLMGVILYFLLSIPQPSEYRWYRDLIGATPFKSVHIIETRFKNDALQVRGTMIKVRCDKLFTRVYTKHDGVWALADFSTKEPQDTLFSRQPDNEPQRFGWWIITPRFPKPEAYRMTMTHRCPEGIQSNDVFEIATPKGTT